MIGRKPLAGAGTVAADAVVATGVDTVEQVGDPGLIAILFNDIRSTGEGSCNWSMFSMSLCNGGD
jgi:hypothetical protein